MTNWDHLDALGISTGAIARAITALEDREQDALGNIERFGPSAIQNRRLSGTRVALAQFSRAAGGDPVADARVRAGFPR